MMRTRSQTAIARTPAPSPPSPPDPFPPSPPAPGPPQKKVKYLSASQMQAAFLHVTKPIVTTPPPQSTPAPSTTKSTVPPSTPAHAPSPPLPPTPPKKRSPPTPKKRSAPTPKQSSPPTPKKPSPPTPKKRDPEWKPKSILKTPSKTIDPPPPPPPVSFEAAVILYKIDPIRFTPSSFQLNKFQASLLSPQSPDFTNISEYINNSQAHGFKINLISILKITRPTPSLSTTPAAPVDSLLPSTKPFTMMLWHGTRPQFVASILNNGFMCPSSGIQMFGQGTYFADRISKSAQYCHPSIYCSIPKFGDSGYLFLCEVVLGKIYNAKNSNSAYKSAPTATRRDGSVITFDSLMCTGAKVPDRTKQIEIDGVTWPLGPTIPNTKFPNYTVNYNEYIVYKPVEMVEIKYLVEVKFS